MTPVSEHDQRYVTAGLVLWLVAALGLLAGVLQVVGAAVDMEGMALLPGLVMVASAVLLGGLALLVRRRSRPAVMAAVTIFGLGLVVRIVQLFTGDHFAAGVLGALVAAAVLFLVARPLR